MALGISGARAGLQDGADEEEKEQELEHGPARIVLVAALDVPREDVRAGELVERVLEAAQRAVQTLHGGKVVVKSQLQAELSVRSDQTTGLKPNAENRAVRGAE